LTKVIHISSTDFLSAVENPLLFGAQGRRIIHKILYLSTVFVDKLSMLWITYPGGTVVSMFYIDLTIRSVDKLVDNRGKICGLTCGELCG
jgi:hypothetical protein